MAVNDAGIVLRVDFGDVGASRYSADCSIAMTLPRDERRERSEAKKEREYMLCNVSDDCWKIRRRSGSVSEEDRRHGGRAIPKWL
jgi:hypothetical protein